MTDIIIENIVASAKVSDNFDVKLLAENMPGSSYNPDDFDGLTIKFTEPKVAVLILSDGKIVCTGAKTQKNVNESIKKTVEKIKKAGYKTKKNYKVELENIVASADLKRGLDLEHASKSLPQKNVTYYPKEFPGLIYKANDYNAVILLFNSGRVVSTGAKTIDDASKSIEMIEEKLTSIGVL